MRRMVAVRMGQAVSPVVQSATLTVRALPSSVKMVVGGGDPSTRAAWL